MWRMLEVLGDHERAEVLMHCRRRRFMPGAVIFHQGGCADSLHLLALGRVKLSVLGDQGSELILRVVGPGETFGELALASEADERREVTATALEPCEVVTLSRANFERLRAVSPKVDRLLVDALAAEVRRLQQMVVEPLSSLPADRRLLRCLGNLARAYGNGDQAGTIVPVTQDVLAKMAGISRPTANQALQKAQRAGLIEISRSRIRILNPAGLLEALADQDGMRRSDQRPAMDGAAGVVEKYRQLTLPMWLLQNDHDAADGTVGESSAS